jgi:hypothetical protein
MDDLIVDNEYGQEDPAGHNGGATSSSLDEIFHSEDERVVLDPEGRPLQNHFRLTKHRMLVKTELGQYHHSTTDQM